MENEGYINANFSWSPLNGTQMFGKEIGGSGNQRNNRDHPDPLHWRNQLEYLEES